MPELSVRPIEARDDARMAEIIRTVMPEFGASGAGFAIHDPEVDWMSKSYAQPRSAYWVVDREGVVEGGGGMAPREGGDADTCELRKMYFLPTLRGLGAGAEVMRRSLDAARAFGFKRVYIETLTGMDAAMRLYERFGFKRLAKPCGDTGHGGCDIFYSMEL